MKRALLLTGILCLGLVSYSAGQVGPGCVTLKDGMLSYSAGHYLAGELIKPGFDDFGYNYQALLFNGYYANAYLGREGFPPYEGDDEQYYARLTEMGMDPADVQEKWYWPYRMDVVQMKWNDAWLSNRDCNGDGLLDRHFGYNSYIGSGAWETNHQSGTYEVDGKEYRWTYFVKIIAVPSDAVKTAGVWYTLDGTEIGLDIWGEFAIIQEVYNDQHQDYHGKLYKSPARAGFGNW